MAIPDNCVKIDQAYIDSDTTLKTGTYLVSGSVTTDARIEISGSVTLILENGCHLTANKGIHVSEGNALTITAQSDDENTMGKLTAYGVEVSGSSYDRNAVIGGNGGSQETPENGGSITINGGKITAAAPGWGAGAAIGGGNWGSGGVISITGGIVTATGVSGAGIGGGAWGHGGVITITGGTVVATSRSSAGIGGGTGGNGGQITITGGDVTACSRDSGAGIGGGEKAGADGRGAGGDIVISGGVVRAYGGVLGGAGIGNGDDADDTPGTFSTQLSGQPAGNAVVYTNSIADDNDTSDWNGIFFIGSDTVGKVYGHVTLPGDYTVAGTETVTIPAGAVLTVPAGVTLTVEGEIVNNGTIICDGTIVGVDKITGTGTIKYPEPEPEPTPETEPEEEETYIPSEPVSDGVHEYSMGKMLYIDGKRVKGLYEYEGATYFFNEQGFMQTGWVEFDEGWRYFAEDGRMVTGWLQLGNVWYYLDPETGLMLDDGLHTIGKSIYYFHDWGGMASDWWYQAADGWYFFGGSGAMKAACWVEWKGNWYYLTETGKMAVNTDVGGYAVNADGIWVR